MSVPVEPIMGSNTAYVIKFVKAIGFRSVLVEPIVGSNTAYVIKFARGICFIPILVEPIAGSNSPYICTRHWSYVGSCETDCEF